jgi:hypothetical protein
MRKIDSVANEYVRNLQVDGTVTAEQVREAVRCALLYSYEWTKEYSKSTISHMMDRRNQMQKRPQDESEIMGLGS